MLDQKGDGRTMGTTTETVIKLFGRTDSKRRGFFVVEGTQAKQIGPTLAQIDIATNDIGDINTRQQFLNEGFRYHEQNPRQVARGLPRL